MSKTLIILNDPTDAELAEGCHRSSRDERTDWTLWADKVVVF